MTITAAQSMHTIYKHDGTPCDTAPRGLKLRLADVFKRPGQGMSETLKELNELTPDDMRDFHNWFEANGYAVTRVPT